MRYREIPRNANNLPNFAARFNEFSFAMRHYIPKNAACQMFCRLLGLQKISYRDIIYTITLKTEVIPDE